MKFNWTIFLNILNILGLYIWRFVCSPFFLLCFLYKKRDNRKILKVYVKYFHEIIS